MIKTLTIKGHTNYIEGEFLLESSLREADFSVQKNFGIVSLP